MVSEGEPPLKKARSEAEAVDKLENGAEKETKEKKDKKEDKEKKEKKESKEKKEKKDKDKDKGKEKKDGKLKSEKKDKKDKKEGKDAKEKKEKKETNGKSKNKDGVKAGKHEKKEKKEKKDKKDKKGSNDKKKKLRAKARQKNKTVKKAGLKKKGMVGKMGKKIAAKKKAEQPPMKVLMKSEDDYEPVNRWWERADGALSGKRGAKKWDSFEHHGLIFTPEYVAHKIPLIYDGTSMVLPPDAEEVATYWVSVKGTPYETKDLFIKNFWQAFQSRLPDDTPIKDFKKCDFSLIAKWRADEREKKLNRPKEEKEAESRKNNQEAEYYAYALLNGIRERLTAFKLEPPQLFRGRGEHPKQGMLKARTVPGMITINCAEDAAVPKCIGMPGHAWKDVVHENTVQWIATFEDSITNEGKYISFAANSGIKGQPDMLKYDRARRLLKVIDKIRDSYTKLQTGKNLVDRQKATATYFIDRLALRVGGEKDTEEEADTVGCCSLRVEHITLEDPNIIHFDFLGKDSIQYKNSVPVTDIVYKNIGEFMKNKEPTDQVFDKVVPTILNEYFKEFMEDLSAKVFRTYNASYTLQCELAKFDASKKDQYTQDELVRFYNDANRQVAILCNHQKAESKTHGEAMNKMKAVKDKMDTELKTFKKHLLFLQGSGKEAKVKDNLKLPKDAVSTKKKIAEMKLRIAKHQTTMQMKEDNKTVSLGTSKVNYMDPRISVAWCKQVDLAIERVFPRTLRTKFPWAMHFKSTYAFD